ncbi:MAG: exodeoxyribonuclease VII small subunit [Gammaproteobacteria bacterium]|nr:exodeoxyribonuclease VII small subunit [Gammaproteobacteria bacterium]
MSKKKETGFEQSLAELEALVEQLERGDMPLEKTLEQFERGIALTRSCQRALQDAEQKVEILLKKTSDAKPEDFDSDS